MAPVMAPVTAPRSYRVVALPGEGVGPEVVEASLRILGAIAAAEGFTVAVDQGWIGEPARQRFGTALPEETLRLCEGADGIVFGAVTQGGLLELRQRFDLFTNLRPVCPSPSLRQASPIKADRLAEVDLLFVRELVSGIYFGPSGRGANAQNACGGDYGFHTMRYADAEIRRVARVALGLAQSRRQHLTVAHKENALPHIPWTRLVKEVALEFPDVVVMPMLVDNLAMQLVMQPRAFDVILAGNLFGDILSDLGGAIAGSIGLLGSASLNADGFGLYEPVHGTAPDIAGKGIANPLGTLAAVVLMLEQWGERQAAQQLTAVQEKLLADGDRPTDLYQNEPGTRRVTTFELVDHFIKAIQSG
ncbi:MAG: isocitrate/isopropylmalate dehydrogenase family protein [Elainellaceae cyanobacterium]